MGMDNLEAITVKLREPLRLISDLSIMCKRKPIRYKIAKNAARNITHFYG